MWILYKTLIVTFYYLTLDFIFMTLKYLNDILFVFRYYC